MHRFLIRLSVALLTFSLATIVSLIRDRYFAKPSRAASGTSDSLKEGLHEPAPLAQEPVHQPGVKEISISDVLEDTESLRYQNYFVRKRFQVLQRPDTDRPTQELVSHVVLERRHRVLMTFDDQVYFGAAGNNTSFGLVSLLGGKSTQLIVSQDVNRGGAQWIVNLSSSPQLILSTSRWGVGREGYDLGIMDLDNDGAYEVTAMITDFYSLQDKMSVSQIPLPEVVFRYNQKKRRYLPANTLFQNYLTKDLTVFGDVGTVDELQHRSFVLRTLLDFIFAGKRTTGWKYFDRAYRLNDKEEIRRRVKSILLKHPVYRFIYMDL